MRCEQSIVPNAPCFPCLLPSPLAHHPWASQSGASEALPVVPFYSLLVPAAFMASPAPQPPECVYIFHVVSRKRPGVTHVGSQRALILSHTPLKPRGTRLGYAAVWASGPASCLPMLPDRRKVDRMPLASPPCPRCSCLQHRPHQTVSLRFCPGHPPAPCSARPMDSLFEELVVLGLLKKSETVPLKDYVGETFPPAPAPRAGPRSGSPGHGHPQSRLPPLP